MESTLPIIEAEVVVFHANKRCLEDLGLFKEVRDMVAATTRCVQPAQTKSKVPDVLGYSLLLERLVSVKSMYWGRSIEQPPVFVWLLRE